jgi:hypothetical protein
MARPIKDNADYFTHDADMRDDPKIKALRRKFKAEGYGVWCMLLEVITDSDFFRLSFDLEILAGDFDVEPEFLASVTQYCIQIGLLQVENEGKTIFSKTLDNRFDPLLSKRKRDRNLADGVLSTAKTPKSGVIASESTQSKVKDSIVEESKGHERKIKQYGSVSDQWLIIDSKIQSDPKHQIFGVDGMSKFYEMNSSILSNPELAKKYLYKNKGRPYETFIELFNSYNLFVEKQFK